MLFQRAPVLKNLEKSWRAKADAIIEAQKKMEIHAANVGAKDLALGLGYIEKSADEGFPWVSANLRNAKGEPTQIPPYRIIEVAGLRIGIVGLLDKTRRASTAEPLDYSVADPFTAADETIKNIEGEGVDLVVVLSAMVFLRNQELARKVKGINFIINGGDARHLKTPAREGETVIFCALNRGKYVGLAHINLVPGSLSFRMEGEDRDINAKLAVIEAQKRVFKGEVASLPEVKQKLAAINRLEADLRSRLAGMKGPSSTLKNELAPLNQSTPDRPDITRILKKAKPPRPRKRGH